LEEAKTRENSNVSKATINIQVGSSIPKVGTSVVVMDNYMAIIQIQIRKNTIEDVLLDGGFGVNIITKQLGLRLGLPKPKLAPDSKDGRLNNHKISGVDQRFEDICSWHS
jgi:hypothetical protein